MTVGSWGRAGHATGRPCGEGGRAPQVSAYSFTFPSVPGDESWPELPRQQVRWLVPVLDLLNHGADPNVAIERAPGAAERAFFARALRRIRCAAVRGGRRPHHAATSPNGSQPLRLWHTGAWKREARVFAQAG